jgi:hypothetical protein
MWMLVTSISVNSCAFEIEQPSFILSPRAPVGGPVGGPVVIAFMTRVLFISV